MRTGQRTILHFLPFCFHFTSADAAILLFGDQIVAIGCVIQVVPVQLPEIDQRLPVKGLIDQGDLVVNAY